MFSLINTVKILKEIFIVYVLNKKQLSNSLLRNFFTIPNHICVFDSDWKIFFMENFLTNSSTDFHYIPPRDLLLLNSAKYRKNTVFIAQSLVEDGRYPAKILEKN